MLRCNLEPTLLWLWCRLAAMALIQPLAQELQYATSTTLKKKTKNRGKEKKTNINYRQNLCIFKVVSIYKCKVILFR